MNAVWNFTPWRVVGLCVWSLILGLDLGMLAEGGQPTAKVILLLVVALANLAVVALLCRRPAGRREAR